jgi:ABC-type Na+ efflux pump permease subunit/membrane protease YdiL (CAAX protease family)
MEKDFRQLIRDRGFLFFVAVWSVVAFASHFAPRLPSATLPEHGPTVDQSVFGSTDDAAFNSDTPVNVGIVGNCPLVEEFLKKDGHNLRFSHLTNVNADHAASKNLDGIVIAFPDELANLKLDTKTGLQADHSNVPDSGKQEQNRDVDQSGLFGLSITPPEVQILYPLVSSDNYNDLVRVTSALNKAKSRIVDYRVQKLGLQEHWWQSFQTTSHIKRNQEQAADNNGLAAILPDLLVFAVTCITTVFSIELICRESIRGTLTLLIATPIHRISILTSKTLIVCWSAFCSLAAAMTIVEGQLHSLKTHMPIDNYAAVILLTTPLIFTIAGWSAFMALRIRTRGTAMARLIPGAAIMMFLAGIASLPGVHSATDVLLVPIANTTALVRDWLMGRWDPLVAFATSLVALLYGTVCMQQAALALEEHGDITSNSNISRTSIGSKFQLSVVLAVIAIVTNFYISRIVLILNGPAGYMTSAVLTSILALVAAMKIRKSIPLGLLTFSPAILKQVALGAVASPILCWVAATYNWLHIINPYFACSDKSSFGEHLFSEFSAASVVQTIALIVCTILLPLSQEILFRAVFQRTASRLFSPLILPVIVSTIYCLSQPDSADIAAYLGFGIILSLIVQKTGSVYPGVAVRVCAAALALGCKLR